MCKLKSAIILKNRIYISDVDSHTELLEELKIKDTKANAEKLFVRAELYPKNNDVFTDVKDWVFNVDQDIIPEWFVKDYEEQRMRVAIEEWAKEHIFINKDNFEIKDKKQIFLKNCKDVYFNSSTVTAWENSTVTAWGNSTVTAWGNSTVTAWGNSTVTAWENSTVTAWENSTVTAWENSTVTAWGNSTVTAWENSTVTARGNSTVTARGNSTVTARGNSTAIIPDWSSNKRENIILSDNSILKDCNTKTIYQSGNWKLELV